MERHARGKAGPTASPSTAPPGDVMALDGVRVTAFSRGWAAPYGTRYLGDYGAEVIKVESTKFSDGRTVDPETEWEMWWELNSMFAEMNRNKLSVTLDLHTPEGQELFKRLAAASDLVVENNRPGAMERFGLTCDELRTVKPDTIMVRSPAYGMSGPLRDYPAIGQCLTGFSGLGYLWGHPGSPLESRSKSAYPDLIVSAHLALAAVAALRHRSRTGEGQQIEIPQLQATASMIGTAYLEHFLNGITPEPMGNRDWNAAPQGVYRCKGDDSWCAIACTSDAEWQTLCTLIGQPGLATDASLATSGQRRQRHDALDGLIQEWTLQRTSHQAMLHCQRRACQRAWPPTARTSTATRSSASAGTSLPSLIGCPARWSTRHDCSAHRNARLVRRPSPALGEHTAYVLREVLGIDEPQRRELEATGAVS